MKLVFLLSSLLALSTLAQAQTNVTVKPAAQTAAPAVDVVQVNQSTHDFGKIPQGRPVMYTFEIVNTGKEPLKLENVTASCGCTTPVWNKEAIAPGATSQIQVGYNAYAEGYFEKPITLLYNGQSKVLYIKGTVYKAPSAPAPENASVKLLKSINQ